jgi:hypothetical protein
MEDFSLYFKVDRKKFLTALRLYKKLSSSLYKTGSIKIRILNQRVEIFGIGITKIIEAETGLFFEIIVPLNLIYDYTNSSKSESISFFFKQGMIRCGSSIFESPYIILEDIDSSSTGNNIMYDDFTILKHYFNQDHDFIKKNNLGQRLKDALENLEESIKKSVKNFKDFKSKKRRP